MKLISLTFDDALDQHLDIAIPMLDQLRLPGTFYTHLSAPSMTARRADWSAAAGEGHELGNHTAFHPGPSGRGWVTSGIALDFYDLDRMRVELALANQWLGALDGLDKRSFAYPGCHEVVGNYGWPNQLLHRAGLKGKKLPSLIEKLGLDIGNTRENYACVLPDLFVAARTGALQIGRAAPRIADLDIFHLPSVVIHSNSWREMRDFIERSLQQDAWPILMFHGVGGGHSLDCSTEDFRDLVHWIADHWHSHVVSIAAGALKVKAGSSCAETC